MNSHRPDPYRVDSPRRVRDIQAEMGRQGVDVYLGSRLRTLSWTLDAFCPWRSFVVIPREGNPTAVTFVIDAARVVDDSWLDEDHVLGYGPMGGQDQISVLVNLIKLYLRNREGVVGIESGMATYLPEGNLTQYEYESLTAALPDVHFRNAHDMVDRLSLIKDEGTSNRFREASRIVDIGHQAVLEAIRDGNYRGMTETEIAGLAAYAMRKAGSEWEWSFAAVAPPAGPEFDAGARSHPGGGYGCSQSVLSGEPRRLLLAFTGDHDQYVPSPPGLHRPDGRPDYRSDPHVVAPKWGSCSPRSPIADSRPGGAVHGVPAFLEPGGFSLRLILSPGRVQ
jgi:hypothetical protein